MHCTEIHSKLVAIMRERLATNLKQLPAVADTWGLHPQSEQELAGPPPPSHFALTNSKQLRILSQVGCSVMLLFGLDGKQLLCCSPHHLSQLHFLRQELLCISTVAIAAAASSDLVTVAGMSCIAAARPLCLDYH